MDENGRQSRVAGRAGRSSSCRGRPWRPWRSAWLGWSVAVLALVVGVPLFLCMPPWNDVTLHDMVVRVILRGGVVYRDVFDTNLPGIDWAMAGIRAAFGWSYEVLRAADLVVIAAEVGLLAGWVRRAGGPPYSLAWFAAAVALWYPFTSEFCHVQRDPWMLLPALVAARLRLDRLRGPSPTRSGLEGFVWGLAVWVKPHAFIPAGALWAVSVMALARREPRPALLLDLAGLLLGGLLAGTLGVVWLVATGAWPYFLDVFLNWNPGYLQGVIGHAGDRFQEFFVTFRPWGLIYFAAIPLAVLALWEGRAFWGRVGDGSGRAGEPRQLSAPLRLAGLYSAAGSQAVADTRALLGAFFLAWFAQAVLIQKGFDYTQVPVMLLAMGVLASHGWAFGFLYAVWFLLLGLVLNCTSLVPPQGAGIDGVRVLRIEHQPFTRPEIVALWPRCFRDGSTPELRNRLGQYVHIHCGTNWEELQAVAEFLRTVRPPLGPRELNCWHDSTHPLYLMLDLEPATRFMHYGTAFDIPGKKAVIAAEVAASRQRYVVSNLGRMTWDRARAYEPGAGGDPLRLPAWFPLSQRDKFPWNQPIRFRAGPYLVHEVVNPLGEIDVADWDTLDQLGPGESP
jgi:hypothetical protein